ncbi:Basic proline-rich protein [Caenorhabditis elegans]|uniref:Basic proline-rich protein n=1 Tax=Caenorhabditis elegans TaxID=6239 RepID=Q9BLB3_CAEEL|nr:Basic proline-rich protein [Caenorhabditis elegans]CCD65546.1 Basic proline-rich protein [Caenorhabditis elegans]|eukprot:NP_491299.1 Uncharacterized protein CELE_H31G24.1 [Caenorhabditis elegans]
MYLTQCTLFVLLSVGWSYACLSGLTGGGGGGGCCPPGPSCQQANHCASSYVSIQASGPVSYAIPPPSYAQPPQPYAQSPIAAVPPPPPPPPPQPAPAQAPAPKYPSPGK